MDLKTVTVYETRDEMTRSTRKAEKVEEGGDRVGT